MKKKRLIFTLLHNNGGYMLSRNFRLQRVGDANWINKNYNFEKIAFSIDELVLLDVTRENRDQEKFIESYKKIIPNVFVPIAIGGGIRSYDDARNLFLNGADKVVINTLLYKKPEVIEEIAKEYGAQSIIASVDYIEEDGVFHCYIENGSEELPIELNEYLHQVSKMPVGEIYLNSIKKDGTGFGYNMNTIPFIDGIDMPIIMSGGAGNETHFIEAIQASDNIDAVATANLFNFIGNALPNSRKALMEQTGKFAKFK